MIKELVEEGYSPTYESAEKRVTDYVNNVCKNILFNTAVFKNDDKGQEKSLKTPLVVTILIIALCCSVAGNIVLVILLVFQKRKNLNLKYDPRERTDFDIDILE